MHLARYNFLIALVVIFFGLIYTYLNFDHKINKAVFDHYRELELSEKSKELKCLADNIYYEAGNQTLIGKMAVAHVTLNRLSSDRFNHISICETVYKKTNNTCQFSWTCDKNIRKVISIAETKAYEDSLNVALFVLNHYNKITDPTNGALFYHAYYVRPEWKKQKIATIEDHIFYK